MAASITDLHTGGLQAPMTTHSRGFVAIFAVSFVVFLLIALIAEVLTLRWRSWWPGAESEKSLIGGVKAAVYTFMSYLY
jgi:light-harvesting complex 1 beta chain